MPRHGKKYRKVLEGVDRAQLRSVEDAVKGSIESSFAKFDETVDVALALGVDPKHSDQISTAETVVRRTAPTRFPPVKASPLKKPRRSTMSMPSQSSGNSASR